jgi:hypothetical protein
MGRSFYLQPSNSGTFHFTPAPNPTPASSRTDKSEAKKTVISGSLRNTSQQRGVVLNRMGHQIAEPDWAVLSPFGAAGAAVMSSLLSLVVGRHLV